MQISTISFWAQVAKLVPAIILVALYVFISARLWGYVTTEIVKSFGG